MHNLYIVFILSIGHCAAASAQEHPSCLDGSVATGASAQQNRGIASSCVNVTIAELFYQRAYYMEPMQRGEADAGLISDNTENVSQRIYPHSVFMALAESLAHRRFSDPVQRARYLIGVYEQQSEMADWQIRGYQNRVEALLHRFYNR